MEKLKIWISAFRLRTLPLSISGIIIGSAFAYYNGYFNALIFFLAIVTTLAYQILSNLANDYGDGVKGTDNENRVGPKRAIQSKSISLSEMQKAIKINILIAIVASIMLIFIAFGVKHFLYALLFFVLAGLAIYASLRYTVGNNAYGYKGKGDLFVFLFFGLVSVLGSYFLYALKIDHIVFLPAISLGLLSTGVLNLNNMRDIENDEAVGKITRAVKLGSVKAKQYHLFLIITAMVLILVFTILYYTSSWNFLVFVSYVPLIQHIKRVKEINTPENYDPELKKLAIATFLLALLLSLGYIFKIFLT